MWVSSRMGSRFFEVVVALSHCSRLARFCLSSKDEAGETEHSVCCSCTAVVRDFPTAHVVPLTGAERSTELTS